jgi:hypothetical protein
MKKKIYGVIARFRTFLFEPFRVKYYGAHDAVLDKRIEEIKTMIALKMPDNVVLEGYKCFSSLEEDGIIETIFKVIDTNEKIFIEIGCGKGLENNTHFLLLNNWNGMWVDGNKNFINEIVSFLGNDSFKQLLVKHCFVTNENVSKLFVDSYTHFNVKEIDFFSLDIDGNDYHIMESLFKAAMFPKVICVEYNAKWGIDTNLKVKYDPDFVWSGDDYMGVSLGAWTRLFSKYDYTLLCCDLAGNNAFFISNKYKSLFTIYEPAQLYQIARYYLTKKRSGHPSTLKMLKQVLVDDK